MPRFRDLTGEKFGRWSVISYSHTKYAEHFWVCRCDCGTEKIVIGGSLKSGVSRSCGCLSREMSFVHGMEKTKTYTTWAQMLSRCRNKKHASYSSYGGRGIKVCERWHEFVNFYADMGEKPEGMSLDRIDNDGDYKPENCKWSTVKQQIRNRRVSPKFEWNGEQKSLAELAEMHGLPWRRVYERIRSGWSINDALKPIGLTGPKK